LVLKKEILDGNTAVAKASYKLSDISFIYPITPSSPMAEVCDELSAKGEKNIFGNVLSITEMQSEGGAVGALHGASLSGSLGVTFTSSQGLLLMLPNMYKIAGEMLPAVIQVASRSVASHALNIFCDHSDVMSARQTGFAMLCSSSVQDAHDFAVASHITSVKTRIPFLHFFDGFRTSHELTNVNTFEDDELMRIYPYKSLSDFKNQSLSPNKPFQTGTNESEDIFFQGRERANQNYATLPSALQKTFDDMEKISGRSHKLYEYFGSKNAKYVIVIMGSGYGAVKSYVESSKDTEIGVLKVNLFRPFATNLFLKELPKTVKKIAVLDRTKEQGSVGEPLYLDVLASINEGGVCAKVFGGRYGLGGKEFEPNMAKSVFENLKCQNTKNHFTVGIIDDLTSTSLAVENVHECESAKSCIFWGMGSDGTVSSAKNITKIIGENTNSFVQGYFMYDSKKSGGLTRSFLRFDKKPIEKPYLIYSSDIVVVNNASYLSKYDVAESLKQNGTLLINSKCTSAEEFENLASEKNKKAIAEKNAKIYSIDANKIGADNGIKGKISSIMQMAFFAVFDVMNYSTALNLTTEKIKHTLAKKGADVIVKNINSLNDIQSKIVEIKANKNWKNIKIENKKTTENYVDDYINPILSLQGNTLPVSKVNEFGRNETSTTAFEKRNISDKIPCWKSEKCLQCGKCTMVCPHAVIRAKLLDDEQIKNAPNSLKSAKSFLDKTKNFVLEISPQDCTGCGLCESVCPVKEKAIALRDKAEVLSEENERYAFVKNKLGTIPNIPQSPVKTQFMPPYFEFNSACAGCGETPYIRLLSQLFGNRLLIANATGCSSIYGGSAPTCPFTKDKFGQGPAWANSLFEDNAEFGLGMYKATQLKRTSLKNYVENNLNNFGTDLQKIMKNWLENFENESVCEEIYLSLKQSKKLFDTNSQYVQNNLDAITKKSCWIVGGDGWAYDIDFGGLDHIMASGENVNVLILDTELYSNTGGQMSKSSRLNTVAKFCANGKTTSKKQLALMAMTYQNVYVAEICLGANQQQAIKSFEEAEKHNGVSIIIAYCPCINHGIDMSKNIEHQIDAVKSGYWHLFRYNPSLKAEGKNPLILDSKPQGASFKEYVLKERRYANYYENAKNSDEEFAKAQKEQDDFYELLQKISKL
jgi:pyruvate-ferredoxin/flavodoxin oxidoreductase